VYERPSGSPNPQNRGIGTFGQLDDSHANVAAGTKGCRPAVAPERSWRSCSGAEWGSRDPLNAFRSIHLHRSYTTNIHHMIYSILGCERLNGIVVSRSHVLQLGQKFHRLTVSCSCGGSGSPSGVDLRCQSSLAMTNVIVHRAGHHTIPGSLNFP
jgi:hypothetical protein